MNDLNTRLYRTEREGHATVRVYRLSDDAYMGLVWKTYPDGYSARNVAGRLVVNDSPISRATAIGVLAQRQQDINYMLLDANERIATTKGESK